MAYQLEETGDLTRTAQVAVPAEEFDSTVNRELRKLAKRVKIRGFRKGKIPLGVMRQRYGDSVQQDVVENLVRKYINEIVDEAKAVLHISRPEVREIPQNGSGQLQFTVDLELRPQIDPIGYLGLEVEKPEVEVTSEELEERLQQLRDQHAEFQAIETRATIEGGDWVTFDFKALGDDENLEQFQGENAQVKVGDGEAMPGIEDALIGADFGSTVTATVETDENFGVPELQNRTFDVELTIRKVERQVLPELDDEFAQQTGEAETALELRANVRKQLEEQKEQQAGHIAENNLVEKLLEQNEFELPPQFLEEQAMQAVRQQLQNLQQQGLDLSQVDLDFEDFQEGIRDERESQLKSEFLLVAVAEKENITVEDEDLQKYFERRATQMGVPADMLRRYMGEEPERMQQAAASALIEKTVNYLLGEATIVEGEWPDPNAEPEPKKEKKKGEKKEAASSEKPAKSATADEDASEESEQQASTASGYDASAAEAAFSDKTVADLKDYLRDADLKVSGKKAELIERLVEAQIEP